MKSVFAHHLNKVYPDRYRVVLHISELHGGVPSDPAVIEAWIRTKLAESPDEVIADETARILIERGIDPTNISPDDMDEAIQAVANKRLNGFYRDPDSGELQIAGYHIKAAIKEAANIAWPKRRWGPSNKGTRSYIAEHVFVPEDKISLGTKEPAGIDQRQVNTWRGTSFKYEEFVTDVEVEFSLLTDAELSDDDWATLWVTGEQQGLGASRSQGFGRYSVVAWDKL